MNHPLSLGLVYTVPLVIADASGNYIPAVPDDIASVASSGDALRAEIGTTVDGTPACILTPTARGRDIVVTATGADSGAQDVGTFDIGDNVEVTLALDFAGSTTAPQAPPTDDGPADQGGADHRDHRGGPEATPAGR